jgi:hypothetical protein
MTDTATAPLFIQLTVEALEDLHTGSGTGGGDIDALVQRDRHGQPVIRASHLKGLLREAGEELIALGKLTETELNALLGTEGTGRGALRLTSLFVGERQDPPPILVWGSTQRVENGRAPKEDTLRFIEHVAAGTCFTATLRLVDEARLPLLERLLNRIDRIGGARNRGSGLAKLDWKPAELTPGTALSGAGSWVRLTLRNLEPLCLPATGYPGNLIRTHSFIRGQTLRGALMAWAIQNGRAEQAKLFEGISVGDALPLPKDCLSAEQVLPIPLSILTDKPRGGDSAIPWWAAKTAETPAFDAFGDVPEAEEKRKRPGAHDYLCRTTDVPHWQRYTPSMRVRLRNATPKRGSAEDTRLFSLEEIAEDTRLFSLEEIAEDTCFQAELRCADERTARDFLTAFAPLLSGADWLALGRGGSPARVESLTLLPPPSPPTQLGDDWTLTLTGDAIVRGERLGFLDNLDLKHLCQLAGIDCPNNWQVVSEAVETDTLHGFNAVTGLTRAPALALRRGSCWRIAGSGSAELAHALIRKGAIGERTDEGCGQFQIGIQPIESNTLGKPPSKPEAPKTKRNEELLTLARQLANRIDDQGPSLSQLQWLRSQAGAVQTEAQLQTLLDEIESAQKRRPQGGKAWEHFPHRLLRKALDGCRTLDEESQLDEKRQLIAYLVQWRVPKAKAKAQEARS